MEEYDKLEGVVVCTEGAENFRDDDPFLNGVVMCNVDHEVSK